MTLFRSATLAVVAGLMAALGTLGPARAATDEQEIVDKARLTTESLLSNPDFGMLQRTIKDAKGVLVFPALLKGGFIVGIEGGSGVLLARVPGGGWSFPAFYTLGGGSFGLQIGAQTAEVMLLIMNDGALESLMESQLKLGGDASIAIGPVGAGLEGSTTTNLDADIVAFSSTKGLYGGIALEGSIINARESKNESYYGVGATTRAIVIHQRFANPGANGLREALGKF
jgi:Uncharacterized conserved protein